MRILSIVSARPNFIKLAGVHHALVDCTDVEHLIVHTGQHYDPLFSDVFFEELHLPDPHVNLGIKSAGSNEETVIVTQKALVPVLHDLKPDVVLVYGDVSGALAGAQAAQECDIPIAHIESGLRSFDADMPEERNRVAIDHMADILFVTEQSGIDNLLKEEITNGVHFVGNTMIDTLMRMMPSIEQRALPKEIPSSFGVVTMHRPSNVDSAEELEKNIHFLNEVAEHIPMVFPVHRRTQGAIDRFGLKSLFADSIHRIDPLGYLPFLRLVQKSAFILTDSGGIQEESVLLKKKCFTLRRNTERPSTIEAGSNELIDPIADADREQVFNFASSPEDPDVKVPQLWDGKAGERIMDLLTHTYAA